MGENCVHCPIDFNAGVHHLAVFGQFEIRFDIIFDCKL